MTPLNRRAFLKLAAAAGVGIALEACSTGQDTPVLTETPAALPESPTPPAATPQSTALPLIPNPTETPATPTVEPVHLQVWDIAGAAGGVTSSAQGDWLMQEVMLFQEAYPWLTIDRLPQADMTRALAVAQAGGVPPDGYMGGPSLASQRDTKQWFCQPISSFADFESFKASFPQPEMDFSAGSNVLDGKAYSAPREARSGWANQVFVNLDVFQLVNLNPDQLPSNDVEFIQAVRQVTKDSAGTAFGYANGFTTGWMNALYEWLGARSYKVGGGDWYTGKSTYSSDPHFETMLHMLATLVDEKLILPEATAMDDVGLRRLFAEGRVAMIHGGMWNVGDWKLESPKFTHYTVLPPLLLGEKQEFTYYTTPGTTGTPWFISAGTRHPEEAWLWFKWLHNRAAGERWVKSENGLSIFPENNNPDFLTTPAWKDYAAQYASLTHIEPAPAMRNPECGKVLPLRVEQNFAALVWDIYSGKLSRSGIPAALKTLADDIDANWAAALEKAQNAGAKVQANDFIFRDWDPLEDYLTAPAEG